MLTSLFPLAPPCRTHISYEYKVWQDSRLGRQKITRNGVEAVLRLVPGERVLPERRALGVATPVDACSALLTCPPSRLHLAVNKMYEVFPSYKDLTCWVDEIHGGTGPTLAGAAQPLRRQGEDEGTWSGEAMAAGLPLSAQRRLLGQRKAEKAEQEETGEGGRYLFDFEKKPAKLLAFVSLSCSS